MSGCCLGLACVWYLSPVGTFLSSSLDVNSLHSLPIYYEAHQSEMTHKRPRNNPLLDHPRTSLQP